MAQKVLDRTNDAKVTAFTFGETAYLLLSINKTASLKIFNLTPVSFQTKLGESSSYTSFPAAAQYMAEANAKTSVNGYTLGWDTATQTFASRLVLDETATDGSVNAPLGQYDINPKLYAQLVCWVCARFYISWASHGSVSECRC